MLEKTQIHLVIYSLIRIFAPVKLSIVVPVYQVEATLDRCMESVVRQDYDNCEVILVDDGSTDQSPHLCDEWAARHNHIRVIHQQHAGLSEARNNGITAATGDYITFVDSDDYLDDNTYVPLLQLLAAHPDIDLLEYPAVIASGSHHSSRLDFPEIRKYNDMETYWYEGRAWSHAYAWNKLYRISLFQTVRYPSDTLFEDIHTLPKLLAHAHCVATTNKGLYHYCDNASGITATADGHALRMLLQPHVDIISKSQRYDVYFQDYYLHVLNIQMDVYELTGDQPILPQRSLSSNYFEGTQKLKVILFNMLGIKHLCIINKLTHKIWKRH